MEACESPRYPELPKEGHGALSSALQSRRAGCGQDRVAMGAPGSDSAFHCMEAEDSECAHCSLGPKLDCSLQGITEPQGHFTVPIPTQLCRVA